MTIRTFLIFTILAFSSIVVAQNLEFIQNFDVTIELNKDRSINVEENIKVYVLGDKIKRGITRSLPDSRTIDNSKVTVQYENVQVFKDGNVEPFFKKKDNGNNVFYIGDRDIILTPGYYQYRITYSVPNQIISGDNKDQLIWNAIGTDVLFKSEKARVTIKLENEMELLDSKLYVGKYGSGQNINRVIETKRNNEIVYSIDEGLSPNEAVTIDVNLNSGSVAPPSFFQKYSSLLTIMLGGIAMFFYFVITWFKYGRDPKSDPSALLYDTPENLSPASINYIDQEKYSGRALTSSFIALATKGFVKISKEGESGLFSKEVFVVEKMKEGDRSLPAEQLSVLENLFTNNSIVYLDGEYQANVKATIRSHQLAIEDQHKEFVKQGNNLKFVLYPILIFVLALVVSTILANTIEVNSYSHFVHLGSFIPLSIIGIIIYRYLIIQPTVVKLNLQEEIKAFKQYIEMSISDLTELNDAPVRDISHFESLLPYAYALGIEGSWSDSFSDLMKQSSYAPSWGGGHYYYDGLHQGLYYGVHSTSMKKPAPGSGGGGGGGFSGGGGGGGGVGGW